MSKTRVGALSAILLVIQACSADNQVASVEAVGGSGGNPAGGTSSSQLVGGTSSSTGSGGTKELQITVMTTAGRTSSSPASTSATTIPEAGGNSSSGGTTTAGKGGATASGATSASGGTSATRGGTSSVGGTSASGGTNAIGGTSAVINTSGPPFTVKAGLFNQTKTEDLGLTVATGTETVTIFAPTASTDHYSNGVVMVAFKGYLYAQWQSSATDEDSPDTWVAYSRSLDGKTWTAPATLVPKWDQGIRTSGGWWTNGTTLVAYVNVWPTATDPGGYTEYATSTDGTTWTTRVRLPMADGTPMNGVFEQDPHALPDGRIINAAHFQPGLIVAPLYTDDPSGLKGWTKGKLANLTYTGSTSREMEPSWFRRSDGGVVMVFRDQASTFYRLASLSADRGQSWSTPVVTNMPDSRSKQSAGNLPDGTAFLVGNPVLTKTRIPLAVTLSHTGQLFDKAFILRKGGSDLQAQRYTGTSKGLGYSYPKSTVYGGYLYVSYSTNKEDVQYTRVPLTSLAY